MSPQGKHYFVLLDGLRGVAAIAVAVLHMPRVFDGFTLPNAHLAVDFFLQLSGFVIAFAYSERIAKGMSFRDFFLVRFNRLYPTYVVGICIGLPVALTALRNPGSGLSVEWTPRGLVCAIAQNALMLPSVGCGVGTYLFPLNPPMWSIFYEFVVNLMFFAFVGLVADRRVAPVAALVGFAVLTLVAFEYSGLDIGTRWGDFLPGLLRVMASFLVGMTIFGLLRSRQIRSDAAVVTIAAVVAGLLFQQTAVAILDLMLVTAAFPVVVFAAAHISPVNGVLTAICRHLGQTSYVLYVIHKPTYQLMLGAVQKIAPSLVDTMGIWLGVVFVTIITLFAWLLAIFYEPAARRRLARLVQTKT
ncbi:acyltransferase family protein [Prosthecomicrobium hirschii]|uniref:acyltransferase family protein n=1 Tax=Prosthecodimorpha hirschii TaxID=665126 RepID=UPI002220413E|nr:acyltransferase [Prosthecomicrobium hirschii]MCW1843775.1 acyltransferase [Prosthecomicrobium hirschii]